MLHTEIESHYTSNCHPRGGTAPLRNELALYNYIERQKEHREKSSSIGNLAFLSTVLDKVISAGSKLLSKFGMRLLRKEKHSH